MLVATFLKNKLLTIKIRLAFLFFFFLQVNSLDRSENQFGSSEPDILLHVIFFINVMDRRNTTEALGPPEMRNQDQMAID